MKIVGINKKKQTEQVGKKHGWDNETYDLRHQIRVNVDNMCWFFHVTVVPNESIMVKLEGVCRAL